jgi:hypothetical protein
MTPHRTPWRLLVAVAALLAIMAVTTAEASAASGAFGQLAQFGERANQGKSESEPTAAGKIAGAKKSAEIESHNAIGVDPEEGNDVFVLDEPVVPKETTIKSLEVDTIKRYVRIQKFTPSGGFVTATKTFTVTSPEVEEEEDLLEAESLSNIAVDPSRGVIYVLAEEPRRYELVKDKEAPVASALYAFKTSTLAPAENADKEGVEGLLVGPSELQAESETAGAPLLEPHGITVDPTTHEVIILGHVAESGAEKDSIAEDHFALQRVSDAGTLGEKYVDKKDFFQKTARSLEYFPTSPVVTPTGHVLVLFQGLAEIPNNFKAATEKEESPTQVSSEQGPEDVNAILESGDEDEFGGSLSVGPGGTLWEPAAIVNEALRLQGSGNPHVAGVAERSASGALIGWSGGQTPEKKTRPGDECVLEPGVEAEPLSVAAGANGDVFVLAPEYLKTGEGFDPATRNAIFELGPNGVGCPTASGSTIDVEENGEQLAETEPVAVEKQLQFSTSVVQADALSLELKIENKATHTTAVVTEPLGYRIEESLPALQQPEIDYAFDEPGEYEVTATVHTDDLTTPEVKATSSRTVKVDEPPVIAPSGQPAAQSVTAGASATFTATAAAVPEATASWEVSVKGGPYEPATGVKVITRPVGKTTVSELTVEKTTLSENESNYIAIFKNTFGGHSYKAVSNAATLTVTGEPKAPEVTAAPQSVSVEAGKPASFTASASGSPEPRIQWEVSTDGGVSWADVTSATSPTLAIAAAQLSENGYQYRAKFTNEFASKLHEAVSGAATLAVTPAAVVTPPPPPPPPPPTTTTTPTHEVLGVTALNDPKATVASTSVTVSSGGALSLKITCPTGETQCIGTITLKTLTAVLASSSDAHDAKAKRAILTLTSGSFSVLGGAAQTVKLHLSAAARSLLAHSHMLRVKATLAAHNPAGAKHTQEQIVTLKLAKKH